MSKKYVFGGTIMEVSEPEEESKEEGGILKSVAAGAVIGTWLACGPIAGIVATCLFGAMAGSGKE